MPGADGQLGVTGQAVILFRGVQDKDRLKGKVHSPFFKPTKKDLIIYQDNIAKFLFIIGLAVNIMACTLSSSEKGRGTSSLMGNPLTGMGKVTAVASGFISTEGPVWHAGSNSLIFSDIPGNTIYSLESGTNKLSILRKPSNTSNGLALDTEGYLLAAEQDTRIISRLNLETYIVEPYITQNTKQREG